MTNTEMICARVEPELKSQAEAVFSELGLSATEAITLFSISRTLNLQSDEFSVVVHYQSIAKKRERAFFTAWPSRFDNVPILRTIRVSSRVKSLKRTLQGTVRPAFRQS